MKFKEAPWDQQSPPPWSFPGTTLNGFALQATFSSLDQWCKDTLDGVCNSSFVPAWNIVYLCVANYPKMIADSLAKSGFSVQNEYFFMFPVIRMLEGVIPVELGWAYPFIGVDNATSVVSGQMVLGLPKVFGDINIAGTPGTNFAATVSMLALLTHSVGTQQKIEPLLKVSATNPVASTTPVNFPTGMLNLQTIQAMLPANLHPMINQVIDTAGGLTGMGFGLRQLRDCADPTSAVFADIVRMRWSASNEQNMVVWQNAQIDIYDNATFPITATLGLTGGVAPTTFTAGGLRYNAIAGFGLSQDLAVAASSLPPAD